MDPKPPNVIVLSILFIISICCFHKLYCQHISIHCTGHCLFFTQLRLDSIKRHRRSHCMPCVWLTSSFACMHLLYFQNKVNLSLINSQISLISLKPNKKHLWYKTVKLPWGSQWSENLKFKSVIECLCAWIHCPMVTNLVLSIIWLQRLADKWKVMGLVRWGDIISIRHFMSSCQAVPCLKQHNDFI